jgi:hypothetical protein
MPRILSGMESNLDLGTGIRYAILPALAFGAVQRLWGEYDLSTAAALATVASGLAYEQFEFDARPYLPSWEKTVDTATNLTFLVSLAGGAGMFTLGISGELDLAILASAFTACVLVAYWSTLPAELDIIIPSGDFKANNNPPPPQDKELEHYSELGDSLKAHEVASGDILKETDLVKRGELIVATRKEVQDLATVIGAARDETPENAEEKARNELAKTARDLLRQIGQLYFQWKRQMVTDNLINGGFATFPVGGDGSCFAYSLAVQEDAELGALLLRAYNANSEEEKKNVGEELEKRVNSTIKLNGNFNHFRTEVRNQILIEANQGLRKRLHEWAEQNLAKIEEQVRDTIIILWETDDKMQKAIKTAVKDDELCQQALEGKAAWPKEAINVMIDRIKWGEPGNASWFDDTTITWYCAFREVQIAVFDEPKFDEDNKLIPTYYRSATERSENGPLKDLPIRYVWYTEDGGGHFEPVFKRPLDQEIDL